MNDSSPSIGHNSGSVDIEIDIADLLDPEILQAQWELDHSAEIERRDALLLNLADFKAKFSDGLKTEDDCALAGDVAKQLRDSAKVPESLHKKEKAPFKAACDAADAFFLHRWSRLLTDAVPYFTGSGIKGEPLGVITKFQRDKLERERQAREAEAKRLREEAEAARAAAERSQSLDVVDTAIQLQEQAQAAQSAAAAPVADLTRTRGAHGSVSSLRDNWTWELEQPDGLLKLIKAVAEGKEPINVLTVNASLITGMVRPKDGVRQMTGIRIFNASKSRF